MDDILEGLGGLMILGIVVLIGWGVLSLFGISFGVENEGTVSYGDCRQTITIQDHSWKTYINKFTCNYSKTNSGKIMSGECVYIVNDSSLFSSSHTCATAYVYEKAQDPVCKSNIKNGVLYPYLGYDDMCHTTPQGGELTLPAKDTIPPAAPSTGVLPVEVGQCDGTTISKIGTRLTDAQGNDMSWTGPAINYADGGYQVSYDAIPDIQDWVVGDSVNLCLVSVPSDCPPGDNRGKVYGATNLRTGETWEAQDSEHSCGGA